MLSPSILHSMQVEIKIPQNNLFRDSFGNSLLSTYSASEPQTLLPGPSAPTLLRQPLSQAPFPLPLPSAALVSECLPDVTSSPSPPTLSDGGHRTPRSPAHLPPVLSLLYIAAPSRTSKPSNRQSCLKTTHCTLNRGLRSKNKERINGPKEMYI